MVVLHENVTGMHITVDKREYLDRYFLISLAPNKAYFSAKSLDIFLVSPKDMFLSRNKKNIYLGPVVQSFVSLMSLLMTNLLTVVAEVFSNTLIFFLLKNVSSFCNAKATHISAKISLYLPCIKKEILTSH